MYQKRLADVHLDLEESKRKVARLTAQETALVQQNARASVQLVAEEKKRYARFVLDFAGHAYFGLLDSFKERFGVFFGEHK